MCDLWMTGLISSAECVEIIASLQLQTLYIYAKIELLGL